MSIESKEFHSGGYNGGYRKPHVKSAPRGRLMALSQLGRCVHVDEGYEGRGRTNPRFTATREA